MSPGRTSGALARQVRRGIVLNYEIKTASRSGADDGTAPVEVNMERADV